MFTLCLGGKIFFWVNLISLAHSATKFGHIVILHLASGLNWGFCRKWLDPVRIFHCKDSLGIFFFLYMFLIVLRVQEGN